MNWWQKRRCQIPRSVFMTQNAKCLVFAAKFLNKNGLFVPQGFSVYLARRFCPTKFFGEFDTGLCHKSRFILYMGQNNRFNLMD